MLLLPFVLLILLAVPTNVRSGLSGNRGAVDALLVLPVPFAELFPKVDKNSIIPFGFFQIRFNFAIDYQNGSRFTGNFS